MPVPGWSGDYDWSGWIPFEQLPHALNPPGGILINANNKMDTSWFGFPLEPFGFSRDAQPRFSKPRFSAVKFELVPGINVQTLHLQNSISLLAAK